MERFGNIGRQQGSANSGVQAKSSHYTVYKQNFMRTQPVICLCIVYGCFPATVALCEVATETLKPKILIWPFKGIICPLLVDRIK